MEFEYTNSLYVSEEDLKRMCDLVANLDYDLYDAVTEIAEEWDDGDYYIVDNVMGQIVAEIERRLEEEN